MKFNRGLMVMSTCLLCAAVTPAHLIHVPADFPTVQAGLDVATTGDSVLVAAGTYQENLVWPSVNGVSLIGAGPGESILDGDGQASVIQFIVGTQLDSTTLLQGFSIINGLETGD